MDDHTQNGDQNQLEDIVPKPLSQEEKPPQNQPSTPSPVPDLVAEEAPSDITINQVGQAPPPTDFVPPVPPPHTNQSRSKFFIIGGGIILFIAIFSVLLGFIFRRGTPKNVELTYWGLWEDKQIIQPFLDEYHRANPNVTVQYIKMEQGDYKDKLVSRSKNGLGPDIFRFHNTWLPQITSVVAAVPTTIYSNPQYEQTFYPVHQKDLKAGNRYYGIPLMVDGLVLVYNEELLKKAGISSPPVTWEDVINDLEKLTVKNEEGQLITSGIAIGTSTNVEHFSDIFGLFLAQNGGSLANLKSQEAVGALESYRKFAEGPDAFWSQDMPNSINAFIQEKVAMIIVPSWEVLAIKTNNQNPTLAVQVAPVPIVPAGRPLSLASYWVEGVSKMSKNQTEAWKFLAYMSQKDTLTKLYELQSKSRAFGYPYPRQDMASLIANNPYIGPVITQAKENSYISMPVVARTFDNGLNDEIVKYIAQAIDATTAGVSYQDALNTADAGVRQVFTKYNISVAP